MNRKSVFAIATLALLGSAVPAMAAPFCSDRNPSTSSRFYDEDRSFGGMSREQEALEDHARNLRRNGIDTHQVERWNGCLRAFVRLPDGTQTMQYFDPNNYRQVF